MLQLCGRLAPFCQASAKLAREQTSNVRASLVRSRAFVSFVVRLTLLLGTVLKRQTSSTTGVRSWPLSMFGGGSRHAQPSQVGAQCWVGAPLLDLLVEKEGRFSLRYQCGSHSSCGVSLPDESSSTCPLTVRLTIELCTNKVA